MIFSKKFSGLIRQKEHILMRLVPISVRQLQIVRSGDMTTLLGFLGQKQRVLDEFEEVEKALRPYRETPPEERIWKNEQERIETHRAMERCTAMLEEILRNDTQSSEEIAVQKIELEERIRRLQQGSQVHSQYAKQSFNIENARHFDVSK